MRSLASVLAIALLSGTVAADPCDIPSSYNNRVFMYESDTLFVGFATDRHVYWAADTVHTYLVVENVGEEEFYLNVGAEPQDEVRVVPADCDSAFEPGCDAVYPSAPRFRFIGSEGTRLQPGQCAVWLNSWEISCCGGPPPDGEYKAFGGIYNTCQNAPPPCRFVVPKGGAAVMIEIDSTVPVDRRSWGYVRSMYRTSAHNRD